MKKYIAFVNVSSNSGMKDTVEEAIEWAAKSLKNGNRESEIFVFESVKVVRKQETPVTVEDLQTAPATDNVLSVKDKLAELGIPKNPTPILSFDTLDTDWYPKRLPQSWPRRYEEPDND